MLRSLAAGLALVTALAAPAGAGEPVDFAFLPAIAQVEPATLALNDITRAGDRLVAVGERGVIAFSDDGGGSWRQAEVPVSVTLTAVSFAGADNGWAVGHDGVILHSGDGGEHWALQFDGNRANAQFLDYAEKRVEKLQAALDAAGDAADAQVEKLQRDLEDAGYLVEDAQLAVSTGPADPFLDVLMLDAQRGFAAGAYGMFYTTRDGGEHWTLQIDGIDNPDRYHLYAVAAGADGRLYLSGEAGLLYRSEDGGAQWQRIEGLYEGSLFGILAQDDAVVTFGLRGHVFRSEDGGVTWQPVETGEQHSLYGGRAAGGEILLFGAAGEVLRSEDGGRSFSSRSHPSRATLAGGLPATDGRYLIVGLDGLATLDWGAALDE